MARKYIKRITEDEFNRYLKMRTGFLDRAENEEAWAKISDQEKARYERDYYALEVKLFHTLGFKDEEATSAKFLNEAQTRFEVYQELVMAEDKYFRDQKQDEYNRKVQETKELFAKWYKDHPEDLKKRREQKPTSFGETYMELSKINK